MSLALWYKVRDLLDDHEQLLEEIRRAEGIKEKRKAFDAMIAHQPELDQAIKDVEALEEVRVEEYLKLVGPDCRELVRAYLEDKEPPEEFIEHVEGGCSDCQRVMWATADELICTLKERQELKQ